jgi:tetratricopeptide (TPR) repeat protein
MLQVIRPRTFLLLILAVSCLPCCSRDTPKPEPPAKLVFRDKEGRQLTEADLAGVTGTVNWSLVYDQNIPEKALELHRRARREGTKGNYDGALSLLEQAREAAPKWPYPPYDTAYTYLLFGNSKKAEQFYLETDKLAPRGYFTCKAAIDTLRREHAGEIPPGTYLSLVRLEGDSDQVRKKKAVEAILAKAPSCPAAWKELAVLLDDDKEKLAAIDKGLALKPDPDTRGVLLIDKALVLDRQGKHDAAVEMLGELAVDPESTLATEKLAKFTLASLVKKK